MKAVAGENRYIDGLVQERRNPIANTMGLCFSCTNPSMCDSSGPCESHNLDDYQRRMPGVRSHMNDVMMGGMKAFEPWSYHLCCVGIRDNQYC